MPKRGAMYPAFLEQQRHIQRAVSEFAESVRTSDPARFAKSCAELDLLCQWRKAMQAIAGLSPSAEFRERFLNVWLASGDHLQSAVADDRVLLDALWVLLPPYTGPGLTLFRGDSARNRRCRSYGLSWTASEEAARGNAGGVLWRRFEGGSVLLQTEAPSGAIICAPVLHDRPYAEQEYLVDRRRLERVLVLERFDQITPPRRGRAV